MNRQNFPKFPPVYFLIGLILAFLLSENNFAQKNYYPVEGDSWERRTPEQAKMDGAKIKEAIDFAIANESKSPRNLEFAHYQTFGREPFGEALGPFKERGEPTGIILRNGYIVAEWGDPKRVDMTFSVTKSFLSTLVGIAYDRQLIKNLQSPVRDAMAPILAYNPAEKFDNEQIQNYAAILIH